jgi:hypothetical protein
VPHAAVVFLAIVGGCSLVFSALVSLSVLALELTRAVGRRLRPGGFDNPPALSVVSPAATTPTVTMPLSEADFSSAIRRGTLSGDLAILPPPVNASNGIEHSGFGSAAGAGRSPGQRRANAT